jgi:hypothetical protein
MKKKHKGKRRNASGGVPRPRPPRPRNAAGPRAKNDARDVGDALKALASSVTGGFVGSLLAGAAVGAGVRPQTAALVTLVGGSAAAVGFKGNLRAAAQGAASAASGQLALGWQVRQAALKAEEKKKAEALAAQNAAPALPAAPAAGAKRNGYEDDDGSDDYRNAGEVEDYAQDDEYAQVA